MPFKKDKTVLILLITILIFFSSYIWNFINIPFRDDEILGEYSVNNHHSLNDSLRYLVFILIPITGYLFFKLLIEKKKLNFSYLRHSNLEFSQSTSKIYIVNLFFIFILVLEFLSLSFPTTTLDIFHEGQKLSSAYKGLLDGSLWSGSYITTGIINENLGARFIWMIFSHESIGSVRLLELIYILIFKILLICLIYETTKKNFFSENLKLFYFLSTSLISLFFIDYDLSTGDSFSYRDIPIIISLVIFFRYINNIDRIYFPLIFLGLLSVVSFLWSIDRALIVFLLLILICFYLLINKKYVNFFLLIFSVIIFWTLTYIFLGKEFNYFIENTFSILKNINYIFGIIHPAPFSDMQNSSRATKSLLLIVFSILISFSFLFSKKLKYSWHFKVLIITLSFVSFCSYIYALGRSDGGHIKQTTGIILLFYLVFTFYNLIKYFEKLSLNHRFKDNFILFNNIILLIFFIFSVEININKTVNYSQRIKQYIHLNDNSFLSKEQTYFVEQMEPLTRNYQCLQLFTYDAALPYLLKKPNCSRYYFIYSVGSLKDQKNLIEEMKNTKLVIYSGQTDNWGFNPKKKLPLVDNYINSNFFDNIKILNWAVKIR
ncbi:hypothetical protein [Candidatus Pelagibacter sp. Uisw_130]|uniref:hypothetical protein n=1 Tax=Candidatus Pelagibacter sp. Uisw_130 TaxID=3230989 RepID=UPI0039E92615